MSKSLGNVVSPDDMVAEFGADSSRVYSLFAAPPDRDLDWQQDGVSGVYRFIGRLYRFVTRNVGVKASGETTDSDRKALRKLHQTIEKITRDFDTRWHFNTSIASLMELMNDLYQLESQLTAASKAELCDGITLMLAPFAPYTAQDLWSLAGRDGAVFRQAWPKFDPALAQEELAEIPVQVNGKLRGHLHVPFGTTSEELKAKALALDKVQPFIRAKEVVKIVAIPDKLVNIVVR